MQRVRSAQSGFSLVELMVVVAIIGILAAIAVPNFQKFTAKSKQSEAKANLSALYASERAFQSEWQVYDTSFQAVGYAPVGNLRYQHGFTGNQHHTAAQLTGYNDPPVNNFSTAAYCIQGGTNPAAVCTVQILPVAPGGIGGTAITTDAGANPLFIAEARGDIDGDSVVDVWTVNQNKAMLNTTNDLDN